MRENEFEKTIIEAGVLLITLLFIIEQISNLPATPPPGDLFSLGLVLIVAVLLASLVMLCGTRARSRLGASIVTTGRVVAAVAFVTGLLMLANLFYRLIRYLGTTFDLATITFALIALGIASFVAVWISKGKAEVHQTPERNSPQT